MLHSLSEFINYSLSEFIKKHLVTIHISVSIAPGSILVTPVNDTVEMSLNFANGHWAIYDQTREVVLFHDQKAPVPGDSGFMGPEAWCVSITTHS